MYRLLSVLVLIALPASGGELRLEVKSGESSGTLVPMRAYVPTPEEFQSIILKDEGGRELPCQWEASIEEEKVVLYWIEKEVERGGVVERTVAFPDRSAQPGSGGVEIKKGDDAVDVVIGIELFTMYHFSKELPKPFCHPVIGPTGKPVTRGFPMLKNVPGETTDHPHHRSWYFTFGDVNGVDFWAEGGKRGRIVHAEFERLVSGPVFGLIRARNDWVSPGGEKVCEDVRSYRFYNVPGQRLIDWEICIRATKGPVKLGDTKEGMAAFRVASSMDVKRAGRIENSKGGVNEKECWGKWAEWCDYSGPVEGRTVGIAFFDHTTSFRHPTYWMVRDYGLFAANPFGLKKFLRDPTQDGSYEIPAGEEITFRYRIYIHEGTPTEAKVAEKYENYVHPPLVTVSTR